MEEAVNEEVVLSPPDIVLGNQVNEYFIRRSNGGRIALMHHEFETLFGHFHIGYQYEGNIHPSSPLYPDASEEDRWCGVKSFKIEDYHSRQPQDGEDPDNEIFIKAYVEGRGSVDDAFNNHVILARYIMSNNNQEGLHHNNQRYYFALYPLARGGDLFENMEYLDEDNCKLLFRQVCEGVKYLHGLGIYHNDLKPENLVTNKALDSVHIIDFGQAIIVNNVEDQLIEKTNAGYGTGLYCAPEFHLSDGRRFFDWRKADIWALGVSLYMMLVKEYPPWRHPVDPNERNFFDMLGPNADLGPNSPFFNHLNDRNITDGAKDLLQGMLLGDVDNRSSLDEILAHPWLNEN